MKRMLPTILSLFAGFLLLVQPELARADEPAPLHRFEDDSAPPAGTKGKVFLTGALVTAGFYLPVLGASYLWPDRKGASDMRIPIVGPWMAFGQTHLCNTEPENENCSDFLRVAGAILLALDGLGQAGGLAIMIEGLFVPSYSEAEPAKSTTYVPYNGLAAIHQGRMPLAVHSGDFEVRPVPLVGGDSDLGLAFVGTF